MHSRPVDAAVADLAGRQHGVVARWQLLRMGVGRRAIEGRLEARRLHPVHRGVYAVGHRALSREGRWMAAVLAAGHGAALSHRHAAAHHGIHLTERRVVDVTACGRTRSRPGLLVHRACLPRDEVTVRRGIPTTGVSRTIFDLAAVESRRRVRDAFHEAEVLRLTDTLSLHDLLARHPGSRGARTIRTILADAEYGSLSAKTELESAFLEIVVDAGLPLPETNVLVEAHQVDCAWRAQRAIAELDGHHVHGTRRGFERDRARDRELAAAGWRVIRVTWRQLRDEPEAVVRDLRSLLSSYTHRRR
jgi:hypothetical protein